MFTFLPKPIYHFITDHNLGGPLVILIALFAVWLFIQASYFLRFFGKRLKLLRILHISKKHIRIVNPLWFFSIHKNKVDFYLWDGEKTLAVKVIGAFYPGTEFCFLDEKRFHNQRHIAIGSQLVMVACGYGKEKVLPDIDFTYQCEKFGIDKETITPVLLWCPAPYCITARRQPIQKRERKNLADFAARFGYGVSYHAGDTLFDKLLMDTAALRYLCKRLSAK